MNRCQVQSPDGLWCKFSKDFIVPRENRKRQQKKKLGVDLVDNKAKDLY